MIKRRLTRRQLGVLVFIFGDADPEDAFDASDNQPMPMSSSGPRFLTDMADVCRNAGLEVVEVDGWETRARGSGGYTGTYPWCVMWHHTASNTSPENDVNYICFGNPDAPVSNLYLARDGSVWVCAAGASNTNGTGGPFSVSKGTVPKDSMNVAAISIEMANDGVGQAWPQVQIDAAFKLSLALTDAYGLLPTDVCTHFDWTPGRKIDPARASAVQGPWQPGSVSSSGTWSLVDIRAELTRRHIPTPPIPTPIPPGDDMPQNYYVVTGANAKFIGIPPMIHWTGPGDQKMTDAIQKNIDNGTLIVQNITGGPMSFVLHFLEGPLPTGDTLYNWTGDEFANSAQIKAGGT